jgi:LysR family glycine cleavage system transcriptional activator
MTQGHIGSSPPLAAVRAFEAAARLRSFTLAARELGVTQSAVSRHIRGLEDHFSTLLFERHGRLVSLTPAGEAYFGPITEAFAIMRSASRQLRRRSRSANQLTISMLPSVASLWLAPRLADFTARHPRIELHVHASRALVDFALDGVDVGIRYGLGDWPGAIAHFLAAETLTPVCSAEFASQHFYQPNAVAELLALPLLADDLPDHWQAWRSAAGLTSGSSALAGPRFDDSASLYLAAANGSGVALGRSLLVERALREGQLVAPFDLRVPATYSYWLVTPSRGEPSPPTRLFMRWAREQAASSD